MVDERIAVALPREDGVVSPALGIIDRILLAVGVEVAEHQHLLDAGLRLDVVDEREQRLGVLDPQRVPAALAVAQISVRATRIAAALGLEVIDHHSDAFAVGLEHLGDRRAAERAVDRVVRRIGRQGLADRRHAVRPEDHADLDLVVAYEGGIWYGSIGRFAQGDVQPPDQVSDRNLTIVLQLDRADDVGVDRDKRCDELGRLPVELRRGLGPALAERS